MRSAYNPKLGGHRPRLPRSRRLRRGKQLPYRSTKRKATRAPWKGRLILVCQAYLQASYDFFLKFASFDFCPASHGYTSAVAHCARRSRAGADGFPQPSQHSSVKQRVGVTDFEVDYSRPNK